MRGSLRSLRHLLSAEMPRTPELIHGIIGEGQAIILFGKGGLGKSILSIQMAASLSCGQDFLDTFKITRPYKVLYIQAEGEEDMQQDRFLRMSKMIGMNKDMIWNYHTAGLQLDTTDGVKQLVSELAEVKFRPEVMIVDPLFKQMYTGSILDHSACNKLVQHLDHLRQYYHCAIILNHHEHRDKRAVMNGKVIDEGVDKMSGSHVLRDWATNTFQLREVEKKNAFEETSEKYLTLVTDKDRNGRCVSSINLRLVGDAKDPNSTLYFEIVDEKALPTDARRTQVIRTIMSDKSGDFDSLVQKLGIPRSTVGIILRQVAKEGIVRLDMEAKTWEIDLSGGLNGTTN